MGPSAKATSTERALPVKIGIWDRPTRLFHWLLVVLIAAAWWTAEEEALDWHYRIGFAILGLLVFRLVWGLIGSSTARFAGFVRGPGAILDYLRGRAPPAVGHNPLGALSVLALLTLLAVQVGLGLFSSEDDGLYQGPLSHHVSLEASETLAERHEMMFNVLLAFIGLHLAAILFYTLVRRERLIGPMFSGGREGSSAEVPMVAAPLWRFLLAAGAALGLTLLIAGGL